MNRSSDGYVQLAKLDELRDDAGIQFKLGKREVGLFRDGEKVYAIDGLCPHVGGPLGEGFVEDGKVYCPLHGWPFNLKTGKCSTNMRVKVECFKTKVESGMVCVKIPD